MPISTTRRRVGLLAAVLLTGTTLLTACGEQPAPQTVLIAVTATANEPAPALPAGAETAVQQAVDSDEGTAELLTVVNGQPVSVGGPVDLRLLRDGTQEIETDSSLREIKSTALLQALRGQVQAIDPEQGTLDTLTLLDGVGRHSGPATVVVISSAVQTSDPINLGVLGFDFDPAAVVDDLAARNLLPSLADKTVVFVGIGDVAGPQAALSTSARGELTDLWLTICRRAGAVSCTADPTPIAATPPTATTPVPVVPVPDPATLVIDPAPVGDTPAEQALPSELLFEPNSANLLPQAADALAPIVQRIVAANAEVHLVGHVWKVTDNDDRGRAADLSTARAQAVRDLLVTLGVPSDRIVEVRGAGFDEPISPAGETDPQKIAAANRVVQVTLVTAG